jgi:hypothetical protein
LLLKEKIRSKIVNVFLLPQTAGKIRPGNRIGTMIVMGNYWIFKAFSELMWF